MIRTIILTLLLLNITGCTSFFGADNIFRDRGSDYLKAEEMPPAEIPDDLDSDTLGVAYPIPQVGQVSEYQLAAEFETPRPDRLSIEQTGQVRIQRLAGDQWILVPAPPGEVWARVRGFLTQNRMAVLRTDVESGVIETALLSDESDASVRRQFHLQLQQGVQLNTTEIVVHQREFNADNIPTPLPAWELGSAGDSDVENNLRLELAEALAQDQASSTTSLLGQRIGAAAKVEVVTPSAADPYILMRLSYERSWASVEYALGTDAFKLVTSDKDAGLINMIELLEEAKDYSWLRRMVRGTPESLGARYQLHLRQSDAAVEVRVTTPDGASLSQREAFEILTLLRSKLA